ncbi:MAG: EI24 domain-containing protein [Aquabacterium sp.]|uniref:EI24 domain-containing protein n=1 Tax=Aquabacterium sp. TaxID=1872578 RepID=UPI001B4D1D3E|nr:EI24 domain-containing protein [Aquabacterium sp.]MBP7132969.1 EI24 domain-containing protein [Aquabacterium sp.]MBP9063416.1 EI24 domain-containing protein [Aquabacterium sp.]
MTANAPPLGRMLDAGWRALAYCLMPQVIWLSLLPLVLAAVTLGGLAWWGWGDGVAWVRSVLDGWVVSHHVLAALDGWGLSQLRMAMAPLVLVLVVIPLVVVTCLLLVATLMTPALVKLVVRRRFPGLVSRYQAPWWRSLWWSSQATLLALSVMVVSLPLWLVPPLAVVLPPLIWGWLTYRVLVFDTLADLATPQERDELLRTHRSTLLTMGVISGYLGAAPAALWALGVVALALAPVILLLSVWIYTLVFAFAGLWFAHFLLAALNALRLEASAAEPLLPSQTVGETS